MRIGFFLVGFAGAFLFASGQTIVFVAPNGLNESCGSNENSPCSLSAAMSSKLRPADKAPIVFKLGAGTYAVREPIVVYDREVSFYGPSATVFATLDGQWLSQLVLVNGTAARVLFQNIVFTRGGCLESITANGTAVMIGIGSHAVFHNCLFTSNVGWSVVFT